MPGTIRRTIKHRRNRKTNVEANQPQPVTPIGITAATAASKTLTLTFDQAVSLSGLPGMTVDVAGADPVSVEQTAPNVVAITFDIVIDAATRINVPFRDPAIRNASGGYVTSNQYPV